MPQPGFVYVLVNPSANEFLKIGKTERDPEARAKELSSATGVPTPFYVAFQSYFQDCTRAEEFVHARLAQYRVASNREFFRVPLRLAIEAIIEAEKIVQVATPTSDAAPSVESGSRQVSDEIWWPYYAEADDYEDGIGDTLQDYEEALRLYKQAAKLGGVRAYMKIGDMYREGRGCVADLKTALNYYKEGAKKGDGLCWAKMAVIYSEEGHAENSLKCWNQYFESNHFKENDPLSFNGLTVRGQYSLNFLSQVVSARAFDDSYHDCLSPIKNEIIVSCDHAIKTSIEAGNESAASYYKKLRKTIESL